MYKADTWVLTGYNFLEMNILHGLSKFFGEDGPFYYIVPALPAIFVALVPLAYLSFFSHYKTQNSKAQSPYITYYSVFYILFFSLIAHKEVRFLMPIVPFIFIQTAELMHLQVYKFPIAAGIKVYIVIEIVTLCVITTYHERASEIRVDLLTRYPDLHSFYSIDVYNTPVFSLLHR
jgi:phosphatidylinositol glycan class B